MSADETAYIPFGPSDLTGARVLVLAPHPDDETFSCGGALATHRATGDAVRVVFLTSGAYGDWSGGRTVEQITRIREAEAGRALLELGVDDWEFWRLPDRGVVADGLLVQRIHDTMLNTGSSLIYAPSPLDAHPDHRATAQALRMAMLGAPTDRRVAFFESSVPIPATHLVDVTESWPRKRRAIDSYRSQTSGPHPYDDVIDGMSRFRALTLGPGRRAEGFRVSDAAALGDDAIWRWAALQEPRRPPAPPLVSVILRTRDRPARLREALASLEQQTLADFEVVVVNDAGSDVAAVLAEFTGLDVRPVALGERVGRAAALNAGIEAARAPLIAYLDDDDVYLPGHLAGLHAALEQHPEHGAAYTGVDIVRLHWDAERLDHALTSRTVAFDGVVDADRMLFENQLPNLAVMHRREAWERIGRYEPGLDLLEDWDFLLRLAGAVSFVRVPGRTAEYRLRDGVSATGERPWGYPEYLRSREALFHRHRDRFTPEVQMRVFHRMSDEAERDRAQAAAMRERVTQLEGELEQSRLREAEGNLAKGKVDALYARVLALEAEAAATPAAPKPLGGEAGVARNGAGQSHRGATSDEAGPAGPAAGNGTGAAPAHPGAASNGNGTGHASPSVAAARGRVRGALRHPDRIGRWLETVVSDPRAGARRLLGVEPPRAAAIAAAPPPVLAPLAPGARGPVAPAAHAAATSPVTSAPARPGLILATGRCGSTLVSEVLREHPDVLSVSEFFRALGPRGLQAGVIDARAYWELLTTPYSPHVVMLAHGLEPSELQYPIDEPGRRFGRHPCPPALVLNTLPFVTDDPDGVYAELQRFVAAQEPAPIVEQHRRVFAWLAARLGRRTWVERSGASLEQAAPLVASFPEAGVVHLHRDGRACAVSMSRHPSFRLALIGERQRAVLGVNPFDERVPDAAARLPEPLNRLLPDAFDPDAFAAYPAPPSAFGAMWSAMVLNGLAAIEGRSAMSLSYEDLLAEPERELSRLAEHLGVEPDPAWIKRATARCRPDRSTWRELPADELAALELACAPGMIALGRAVEA